MSLIKCDECKKEISDKVKKCPHCGFPIKKKVNKLVILGIVIICVVLLVLIIVLVGDRKNYLTCTFDTSNNVGSIKYKLEYTFENGKIKTLKGYQYAKPTDSEIAEALWAISNKNQDQYNYYDGLSYKATFSENKEIIINYSIDTDKAPTMFNTITELTGITGITTSSSKEEIKSIYEKEDFICK